MLDLMNKNERRGVAVLSSQEMRILKHANYELGVDVYFMKNYIKSMDILVEHMENEHDKEALTMMVQTMKEHISDAIKKHEKIKDILR